MSADGRFGPQTELVDRLLERLRRLTPDEARQVSERVVATWDTARTVGSDFPGPAPTTWGAVQASGRSDAWQAARQAAWDTIGDYDGLNVRDNVRAAARDAAAALVVRDLIPSDVYQTMTGPVASVIGPLHPDDAHSKDKVRVYARYEWDCPSCGEVNDEGDIEPAGDGKCSRCGREVMFE